VELSDEDQTSELDTIAEYERKYRLIKLKCDKLLGDFGDSGVPAESSSPERSVITTAGATAHRTFKLPKIEIKKFNGDLKEWLGFSSQFEKIHNDTELHASDKFQYLVLSTVSGTSMYMYMYVCCLTALQHSKAIRAISYLKPRLRATRI
jgi:hypothetical protein